MLVYDLATVKAGTPVNTSTETQTGNRKYTVGGWEQNIR